MTVDPRPGPLVAGGLCLLGLALLAAWLLPFGWEQRRLFYKEFTTGPAAAGPSGQHAEILYAYGAEAEGRLDSVAAAAFYRRAVARDPLHLDAWLRLAELRAAAGDLEQAGRIATFCSRIAAPVVRWKWRLSLLAHGLDRHDLLEEAVNFLAARRLKLDDALFLLETHFGGDAQAALAALAPGNRPAFLAWAMRWQRPEAAWAAWAELAAAGEVEESLLDAYVHFLVARKEVPAAQAIRQDREGAAGLTNAGFESEPTGRGFDWTAASDRAGNWKAVRVAHEGRDGGGALKVDFGGRSNVAFQHVRQIVPLTPGHTYRLRWWWKSRGLTTDQTPFVEVAGYDGAALAARSAPIGGTQEWQPAELVFAAPPDCHAVVVALKRVPSKRFDSNIQGTIWVDDFAMELISTED